MLVPWGRGGGLLGRRVDGATFAWGAVVVLPEGRDLIDLGLEPRRGGGARGGAKGRVNTHAALRSASSMRSSMRNGIGVNQGG